MNECATCKYFTADLEEGGAQGWCSRYAPQPVWLPKGTYQEHGWFWKPVVFASDYCGDYRNEHNP